MHLVLPRGAHAHRPPARVPADAAGTQRRRTRTRYQVRVQGGGREVKPFWRVLALARRVPLAKCAEESCTVALSLDDLRRYEGFCGRHYSLWWLAVRRHR